MENDLTEKGDVSDIVRKIVEKAVKAVAPKETSKNRMTVGGVGFSDVKVVLWQPHNLRLYFDFNRAFFNPSKPTFEYGSRIINGSEVEVADFFDCRVVVKKSQVELTNKINHKDWYPIRLDDSVSDQVEVIMARKVHESIFVLKRFIRLFGGVSNFRLLNLRSEDKVQSEDVIDRIPSKMAFHSKLVKKVYNESNVEFKDSVSVVNYLESRALESVFPDLNSKLDCIISERSMFERALADYTAQINLHLKVEERQLVVQDRTLLTLDAIRAQLGGRFSRNPIVSPLFSSLSEKSAGRVSSVHHPRSVNSLPAQSNLLRWF